MYLLLTFKDDCLQKTNSRQRASFLCRFRKDLSAKIKHCYEKWIRLDLRPLQSAGPTWFALSLAVCLFQRILYNLICKELWIFRLRHPVQKYMAWREPWQVWPSPTHLAAGRYFHQQLFPLDTFPPISCSSFPPFPFFLKALVALDWGWDWCGWAGAEVEDSCPYIPRDEPGSKISLTF